MLEFEETLKRELALIEEQGLRRELRQVDSPQAARIIWDGRELVNFASNDYLGLANHPSVKQAAVEAVERFGAGSGASRLICGSLAPHHRLEEALAAFKGLEAAVSFGSGYAAALGTIGALLGKDDCVVVDRLVHACFIDAARLSGAKLRVFRHNDLGDLERVLRSVIARCGPASGRESTPRILVVTESVFSMDGDLAPLKGIVELKERYGAWLMLDEAHATGLFGERRNGLASASGVGGRIEIQMGTLGKALGASGGFICGSRRLIDLLVNRARSFIFSTAPAPAASAAALAAINLVQSDTGAGRCRALWERVAQIAKLARSGWTESLAAPGSPILPVPVGEERDAVALADRLREHGFGIPAVRYPAVPRGKARLRMTLTAGHSAEDITRATALLEAFGALRKS